MTATQELNYAKENAIDLDHVTYHWIFKKDLEQVGCTYVNGVPRMYYKSKGGLYYYENIDMEKRNKKMH